ncbi:solute carrier family 46 member 3-like [Mercenaria mercenaria]|uniref:solute carrier family 46 member 3-like n=1 Tax=Mercenaria mercenaria TaxID=6596 RepID=UPI00234F9959|nr:solute carrier family 46 member 3-like [Mercenaria mercenaria]
MEGSDSPFSGPTPAKTVDVRHESDANDENKPLLTNNHENGDDLGYRKFRGLEIDTTWLHWLIGPIIFAYMFAMLCSYYALVEYTNQYFMKSEYTKANLSLDNTTDAFCEVDKNNIVYQTEVRATSEASTWNVYYAVAAGVPAVLSNMVLGSYTDAIGRKFLLAVGIIGTCLRLSIAAVTIYLEADIIYLLIACFVEGCTGQYATTLQVGLAYIADITKPGRARILGIIFVEFVIGVGLSGASLAEGYMVEWKGYMFTFASMAAVLVLTLLFMIFLLPETLTKEHRHRDKSCVGLLKISLSFFVDNDSENRRWKYQLVLLIHALCNISFLSRLPTETLYQLASPFCWSPTKIGIYAAIRTLVIMFVGLGSVHLFSRFIDEIWICMIGTVSYGAAFFWTAFVDNDLEYYIIIAVGCFGPLSTTMQRSILSHLTPPERQGAIFSAVGTLEVVTSLLANVMTSWIYAATVSYMRGLVFLTVGGFDAICIVLLIVLKIGWHVEKRRNKYKQLPQAEIIVPES